MATKGKSENDPRITAYLGTFQSLPKEPTANLDMVEFAAQLIRRIDSGNVNAVIMKDLETTLSTKCPRSPAARAPDFDRLGTQLWNAAIRLKDQSSPLLKTWPQFESQLRVLAYFLLDTAQRSYVKHGSIKSSQNLVRILKTALKAVRICIAAEVLLLCTMLFEKVAEHVEHIQDSPREHKKDKQESEAEEMLKELMADYHLLRATLSWKQNKPDNVSYWLGRVLLLPHRSDMLHLAEKKADLTYEVGKAALQKKQFPTAARWLEQSYQVFDDIDPEMLSSELCDLRVVVMIDYGESCATALYALAAYLPLKARSLVGVGDADSLVKASSLIVTLDQNWIEKIVVMRLTPLTLRQLIWKAVTTLQQSQNEDEAARWCSLANHNIFATSGEINKAKLARKSMTVALSKGDVTAARAAYHQMSDQGKSAAMTQYLMYKLALQENDAELGVSKSSSKNSEKYLYACALEAQQIGDRKQFIATLNKILELHEKHSLNDVRCIVGSIETELKNNNMPLDAALKHCSDMQPELLTRFMMASVAVHIEIKEFEMVQFDLEAVMRLEQWNDLDTVLSMCLETRHSNRLESAADLIIHIQTHITSNPSRPVTPKLLVGITSVLEKIINTCWRNNKDITRLARWIRCLFQMTLTSDPIIALRCLDQASAIASKAATRQIPEAYPPEELDWLASTAFNHAVDLWFAGIEAGEGQGEDNEQARTWAEKALMLAGSVGGVGVGVQGLHKVLQDKWMRLKDMSQGQGSGE
ncbi:hypothetical protein E4T52_14181 [Aureobasidium sp. EXF-3400]|nr:hypothetical protein E4T52_14181 [Aureobasidium sp. EXF-3400]